MTKRMLIDDTHPEETRVVVVNGNKVEDVEFESSSRKQIKGNIYLAKVMRVEPSLQAAFVDYGGNKHGFLAFGEIHPDYYNLSAEEMAQIDKEVDEAIESKKQSIKDREEQRERQKIERAERQVRYEAEKQKALEEAAKNTSTSETSAEPLSSTEIQSSSDNTESEAQQNVEDNKESSEEKHPNKRRIMKKRFKKKRPENSEEKPEPLKVLSDATGIEEEIVKEEKREPRSEDNRRKKSDNYMNEDEYSDDDDDDEQECDFELQKKLLKVRKLFHRSNIQEVIKEGQILIIQVVKEERGNKGAALTTYLSLAGRYCVLMPNRIKSGGVSRKITNANDRKRLKSIVRELPLTTDMSMIVRTAGEDKTKADIVRDYNYLIRSWNQIRIGSLSNKAPALIHEEGNLIKRALRDMYTKEISEIIVDGDNAYQMARDFVKILSPHNLKKIKCCKKDDIPLFQRFQVEGQLDKLHEATVQLESGGYLVINPTEALVSIDVNSGRATKEKDLEETALKTNLEAADEIAKQLRMRNLAGLIVIDFIDMEEQQNNHAVEKRMKEAMKKDRARIQIAKMSCFGLLEISRQRMHSSFMESNYQVCPHCRGQGMVRTIESATVLMLRSLEEEGIKNRSSKISIAVPSDVAIYLLNQKRQTLCAMEQRYKMEIVVSADDSIKNISEFKIERIKSLKDGAEDKKPVLAESRIEENPKIETAPEGNRRPDNRPNRPDNRQNNNNRRPDNRRPDNRPNDNRFANKPNEAVEKVAENIQIPAETLNAPVQQNIVDAEKPVVNSPVEVTTENQNAEQVVTNDANGENNNLHQGRRRDRRRDRRGHDRRRDNRERYNNGENSNYQARENEPRREKSETVILYNSHESTKSSSDSQDDNERQGKSNWWRKLIG